MNTLEYLDAAKLRLGIESDYALAKVLKMRASTISNYRARGGQMDDEIAMKVAQVLNKEPGLVMLDMHIERCKTPELRAALTGFMEKISASFNALLLGAGPRPA